MIRVTPNDRDIVLAVAVIDFEDGDRQKVDLPHPEVRPVLGGGAEEVEEDLYPVGARVEMLFDDGVWYKVCVCARARVRACVRACERACVHACMRACVRSFLCVCVCLSVCLSLCLSVCLCMSRYVRVFVGVSVSEHAAVCVMCVGVCMSVCVSCTHVRVSRAVCTHAMRIEGWWCLMTAIAAGASSLILRSAVSFLMVGASEVGQIVRKVAPKVARLGAEVVGGPPTALYDKKLQ